MCFKCGGTHNNKECKKSKGTPAKCVLCGGNHPSNYKGCEQYHNLIKGNNTFKNNTQRTTPANTNIQVYGNTIHHSINLQKQNVTQM